MSLGFLTLSLTMTLCQTQEEGSEGIAAEQLHQVSRHWETTCQDSGKSEARHTGSPEHGLSGERIFKSRYNYPCSSLDNISSQASMHFWSPKHSHCLVYPKPYHGKLVPTSLLRFADRDSPKEAVSLLIPSSKQNAFQTWTHCGKTHHPST